MKNTIRLNIFFLLVIYSNVVKGQRNLQFSKAIFIEMSTSNTNAYNTLIVPLGKVIKITTAQVGNTSGLTELRINNSLISVFQANSGSYTNFNYSIWLPTGTYYFWLNGYHTPHAFISGIEFNITQ
ncbi:MAG: hypothetical protein DRI86_15045 [Bacteroidetes bacterium]|nr:MAG: hypothetical protein DRI86_15045 [Bacteroidota bacterium]